MNWNYNQANYNEQSYNLLNQGNYKVRIMSVRETIAKNSSQQQKTSNCRYRIYL